MPHPGGCDHFSLRPVSFTDDFGIDPDRVHPIGRIPELLDIDRRYAGSAAFVADPFVDGLRDPRVLADDDKHGRARVVGSFFAPFAERFAPQSGEHRDWDARMFHDRFRLGSAAFLAALFGRVSCVPISQRQILK